MPKISCDNCKYLWRGVRSKKCRDCLSQTFYGGSFPMWKLKTSLLEKLQFWKRVGK